MTEFELIARFFDRPPTSPSVRLGVGDDAALLSPTPGCLLVATVDMLVAGRHFFPDVDPESLGHKALAVNLSDIAAMGARPRWALLAGALPDTDPAWLEALAHGFFALAGAHDVDVVGGDTTSGPLNLCVTLLGEVPEGEAITRAGAKAGDSIYVSGVLGEAALAVAALRGGVALEATALAACKRRLEWPAPRLALGQRLRGVASAMLDVSDGLTGDLGHILKASHVGATLDLAAMPVPPVIADLLHGSQRALALDCLLAGGDDYELCFTAPPAAASRMEEIARESGVPVTRIGTITASHRLIVNDERGTPLARVPRGFDHFARSAP